LRGVEKAQALEKMEIIMRYVLQVFHFFIPLIFARAGASANPSSFRCARILSIMRKNEELVHLTV
jgi:hypothetical protein